MNDLATPDPELVVIIPIFKHSGLLAEAVESVLKQQFTRGLHLVLVNDGCPFSETHELCQDYAFTYPETVTYLRQSNDGLSAARNSGIRHVLEYIPSAEAIYLLDADNRIRPHSLSRAKASLDADPSIDWIYPDIDMFGLASASDYGGPYSLLIHSVMNICEAGSLIHRRVFEAGVLFDTSFNIGWEDWDFFLCAAEKGFRGKNVSFGLQYRKRPESMLAESRRETVALDSAILKKHERLFQTKTQIQLEQTEAPRYAIHLIDEQRVLYCVDPEAAGTRTLSFAEFDKEFWHSVIAPGHVRTPPLNIFVRRSFLESLSKARILHNVLWKMETAAGSDCVSSLALEENPEGRLSLSVLEDVDGEGRHRDALLTMVPKPLLKPSLMDGHVDEIESIVEVKPTLKVVTLKLSVPERVYRTVKNKTDTSVSGVLSAFNGLRDSKWKSASGVRWGHRTPGISLRGAEHTLIRKPFENEPVYPRLPNEKRNVGFLFSLIEFEGVEGVGLQIARGLRAHGWTPHAVVLGSEDIAFNQEWQEVFSSINLVSEPDYNAQTEQTHYFGTEIPSWATRGQHGKLLSTLQWLDVAINFHGGAAVGMMGQLRQNGIKTLNCLHLNDLSALGMPNGDTYLGLAYEHAFDYFVPCSKTLGTWLHGMGVPQDKIVSVQNAPGFEIDPKLTAGGIAARKSRNPSDPLRVLFLGRLDHQNGLDHLNNIIMLTRTERIDIEWRILGGSALAKQAATEPVEVSALEKLPVFTPAEPTEAYAWADVVVLLSRYEELPLTVLDALRAGAVMIATDVGAIREILQDGVNGVLLPEPKAISGAVEALKRFSLRRGELERLSDAGVEEMQNRSWTANVEPLVRVLDGSLPSSKLAPTGK